MADGLVQLRQSCPPKVLEDLPNTQEACCTCWLRGWVLRVLPDRESPSIIRLLYANEYS